MKCPWSCVHSMRIPILFNMGSIDLGNLLLLPRVSEKTHGILIASTFTLPPAIWTASKPQDLLVELMLNGEST